MQLGEALGGSVDAMMRSAGYTDTKLFFKAVEDGKIMANDVLPKFGKELQKMAKEGGALDAVMGKTQAQFTRFMNSVQEASLTIYESGAKTGLAYGFGQLSDLLVEIKPALEVVGQLASGAMTMFTAALKTLALPLRGIIALIGGFGETLKALGVEDGTGLIWRLVGGGGALVLMATKFKWATTAVMSLNAQLVILAARLAPILAAYAVMEDVILYARYGDKANTVTGDFVRGAKQLSGMGIGDIVKNTYNGFAQYSPLGWTGMLPTVDVNIKLDGEETKKMVHAQVVKSDQSKNAATQTEVSQ